MTCEKSSSGVLPKKGTQPTRNSYSMIPIDHQSTGFPKNQTQTISFTSRMYNA